MNYRHFFSYISFLLTYGFLHADVVRQPIHDNWVFRSARETQYRTASVPGTVHTDLMNHGEIPDPYIDQNERLVQWVDKEDWIYETVFDLEDLVKNQPLRTLVLEGIDTYADIYLNDSLIGQTNNMFRTWDIPLNGIVKDTNNNLKIYFHSPLKVDIPKYDASPFHYYAGNDQSQTGGVFDKQVSVFARKAPYQYGWDWGPRLVTSGIWRPIYIEGRSEINLNNVFVKTDSISKNKAFLTAQVTIEMPKNSEPINADVQVLLTEPTFNSVKKDSKTFSKQIRVLLLPGENVFDIPIQINNPKLWWSNGLGEPNMYDVKTSIFIKGKKIDVAETRVGIRTLELVKKDDDNGRSFYFSLNGVPVFAKGANYIPNDNFLPRVTKEKYKNIVQEAADANMNMLRVWGGGVYEDDYFYELCDSLGIMVWQDFMFACSMYPADSLFLSNVREEAIDNVTRLRNHPSIALWCGNNEVLEAWLHWGIKRQAEKEGGAEIIWQQYYDLFHDLLPEIVNEYSPGINYVPSSPYVDINVARDNARGDVHEWNVWVWGEPVEVYDSIKGRFISEYGFQSFPEYNTVLKYAPDTLQHFLESNVIMAHQRGGVHGNKRMEKYMLESYKEPENFEEFLYQSQVQQGDAVKRAIESHRRAKPYCMGSLYWQINDCWPVASWSSIDYYGNKKALHYFAKKAFDDILVSAVDSGDNIEVFIISDLQVPVAGVVKATAISLDGNKIGEYESDKVVTGNHPKTISIDKVDLLKGKYVDNNNYIVALEFVTDDKTFENIWFPAKPKDMEFLKPEINVSIEKDNENYIVTLNSDKFVRALNMSLPGETKYSDNYFDLLPGRNYYITIISDLTPEEIREKLKINYLR